MYREGQVPGVVYAPEDMSFSEEQPLPAVVSPTADSPGYIPESDPEEEDEEDPEEDPAYYPADIGDDDEEDEEEEHLASADSTVVALPAVDRTDSIFFIISPFPQTPSHTSRILSPLISPTRIGIPEELFTSSEEASHPGCPISRELDYGITDEWDGWGCTRRSTTTIVESTSEYYRFSTTFDQENYHSCMVWSRGRLDGLVEAVGFSDGR
ncbi:hypothetical protein Tco_1024722 [Tanacetum coccineum]